MNHPSIFYGLNRLKAKTPPSLAAAAGADPKAKAYGIYYIGTEARVTDGYSDYGFSFWIYSGILSHPVIAYVAASYDFGSDETEPRCMLCFEVGGDIYFGHHGRVQRALGSINEHLTTSVRGLAEIINKKESVDLNTFLQRGGFEFLLGPTKKNEELGASVIQELDKQITLETIEELATCPGKGMEAMNALIYASNNAARLGLDPEQIRKAKEKYEENLFGNGGAFGLW